MPTIVVGVEDSFRAEDAVALAGDLARPADAEVVAVSAYLFDDRPQAHYNPAIRDSLAETAERTLDRLCQPLNQLAVRQVAVADPSPARALLRAAAASDAELIVIGSSHGEFTGTVQPGGTAWRLLAGAPCAVALAPQGYRMRPHLRFNRVTAAFNGSPGGYAALSAASRVARATGQTLRVVGVFGPDAVAPPWLHASPGVLRVSPDAERELRGALERAVADHPGSEAAFLVGDPAQELCRESEVCDVMILGSRDYGPEGVVALGGVGDHVLRTAACPVIVMPNGGRQLFGERLSTCGELRIDSTDGPGSHATPVPIAS